MKESFQSKPPVDAGRRSKQVALVLLGTMGVVGGAVVWDAWQRARVDDNPTATQPDVPSTPIAADRDYQNNDFTPGVGYYHAPYRSWFPFPFNHYDASRGYFGGGLWQAVPFAAGLLSSRPIPSAAASALAVQQRVAQEQNTRNSSSSFSRTGGSTFGGSSFSSPTATPASPRPNATPSSRPAAPSTRPASSPASAPSKPSIQRGGFGSSGKSSGGSSS